MVSDTVAFLVILCFNLLRGIQYHYLVTAIIKSPFVFQGILSKKCFGAEIPTWALWETALVVTVPQDANVLLAANKFAVKICVWG